MTEIKMIYSNPNKQTKKHFIQECFSYRAESGNVYLKISFVISNRILKMHLTKDIQILFIENSRTLLRGTFKMIWIHGEMYHVHGLELSVMLRHQFSSSYLQLQCDSSQNCCRVLCRYSKANSKISLKIQRT